jgi:phytoene dehydrogenase-like protein
MGNVAGTLERAARSHGAELLTKVDLRQLDLTRKKTVEFEVDGRSQTVEARFLLVNFGLNVLAKVLGKPYEPDATDEGSVFKINMLVHRLPKVKDPSQGNRCLQRNVPHQREVLRNGNQLSPSC